MARPSGGRACEVTELPGAAPVVCGDVRDGGSRRRVLARPRSGERGVLGVACGGRGPGLRRGHRGCRGDVDGVERRSAAASPGSTAPAGGGPLSTPVTEREGREI